MATKTSGYRLRKKHGSRGTSPPNHGRTSRDRVSPRANDQLDHDGDAIAKREQARAVRRSVSRTGMTSTGPAPFKGKSRRIPKHARPRRTSDVSRSPRERELPEKLSTRKKAPASSQRKGGPGKRRAFPKKTTAR